MQREPLFFFGIAQKPGGWERFESYLFLYNTDISPILDVTVTKKGEFYYLLSKMEIGGEVELDTSPWWEVQVILPHERRIKKTKGLEVCHLPDKETVLTKQGLPPKEPIRLILWLEMVYTESEDRRKDFLLCAVEPDGVNLLPVLTSEDPYRVISKRVKELKGSSAKSNY
jgi:hypothetical protein